MARTEVITDDLDGSPDAKTVSFAPEGVSYEIDLTEKNLRKLRGALDPFTAVGRKVSGRNTRPKTGRGSRRPDNNTVRAWLRAQGHAVVDRGVIKADLEKLFDDAR